MRAAHIGIVRTPKDAPQMLLFPGPMDSVANPRRSRQKQHHQRAAKHPHTDQHQCPADQLRVSTPAVDPLGDEARVLRLLWRPTSTLLPTQQLSR